MTGSDRNRARGDGGTDCLRGDICRIWIDIDEHRPKVVPNDGSSRGEERETRDHDFAQRFVTSAGACDSKPRQRFHARHRTLVAILPATQTTPSRKIEPPVHEHQPDRATTHRNGIPNSKPLRDRLFQLLAVWALCEPATADDIGERAGKSLRPGQSGPDEWHTNPVPGWIASVVLLGN